MNANNITVQMDHQISSDILLARTTNLKPNWKWNRNTFNDKLHVTNDHNIKPKLLLYHNAVLCTFSATKR